MWNGFQDWEDAMILSFSATYSRYVSRVWRFSQEQRHTLRNRGAIKSVVTRAQNRVFGSSDVDFSVNLSHNLTQVFPTLTNFHVFVDQT